MSPKNATNPAKVVMNEDMNTVELSPTIARMQMIRLDTLLRAMLETTAPALSINMVIVNSTDIAVLDV